MDKLRALEEKAQYAEKVLRDVLLQQFPIGMAVSVLPNTKPVNPARWTISKSNWMA